MSEIRVIRGLRIKVDMFTGYRLRLSGVAFLALLTACTSAPTPAPPTQKEVQLAPEAAPVPAQTPEQRVQRWLEAGDRALGADQLLTPLSDNAHDRYRAVLIYEPNNSRALSGLQAIALRYLDLARSAAQRSAFSQAQGYLDLAASVDPGNPLVKEFREKVSGQQERLQSAAPLTKEGRVVQLNGELLRQRAESLIVELQGLARQVKDSGEFVLIVARTDAEGRWVYQQMRDGVSDYLLRGDIQLGAPPRIELQPL